MSSSKFPILSKCRVFNKYESMPTGLKISSGDFLHSHSILCLTQLQHYYCPLYSDVSLSSLNCELPKDRVISVFVFSVLSPAPDIQIQLLTYRICLKEKLFCFAEWMNEEWYIQPIIFLYLSLQGCHTELGQMPYWIRIYICTDSATFHSQ